MIPKIIYYTWISPKPLPEEFVKYIDGWKKIMPDYEIRPINLDNCPRNEWVNKAIEIGKYVLAGHYARCQRIYETGGIYLDIDIEILKPLDKFLDDKMFIGRESDGFINNAIYGAVKGHEMMKDCMKYMDTFPLDHPEVENETGPRMFTKLIKDAKVYDPEFFYPYLWNEDLTPECVTENTYAIHHWASTWVK